MTTTYSMSIAYSVDDASFGDGDEPDFEVDANSTLSLSLNIDSSGNVTGTAAGSGSLNGFAEGDTDGDDDSFSADLSGSTTVTGTVSGGINFSYTTSDGGLVEFTGTFNKGDASITGTETIIDPSLGQSLVLDVTLSASSAPTALPATPTEKDEGLADHLFEEGTDAFLEAMFKQGMKQSASLFGPLSRFPTGLQGAIQFLGGQVHGNALPWGDKGAEATAGAFGHMLTLAGVFQDAYAAGSANYQNGAFSTPAELADVKLVAGMASGYVGEIVTSGAVAGYVQGLLAAAEVTGATAGLVATGAGFVVPVAAAALVGYGLYTVGSYLVNGQPQTMVDGVDFCGPQPVLNQAQTYIGPAPAGSQRAELAAGGAALAFGNKPGASYGGAAPQAAWSFDTSTGVFTWLLPSSAALTQVLSQMGITQFATPLTIAGAAGELITGGPDGDHLTGAGNDLIIGGNGNNTINGGGAGNVIEGGTGNNTLTGGGANNTFVFTPGDKANTITDFQSSDRIDLSTFTTFHDASQALAALSQSGANTVITLGSGDTVTLLNVSKGTITAADFVLAPLRDDFHGAGASDVLIENTAGAVVVGELGTNHALTYAQVGALGSTWQFHGAGDFLGGAGSEFLIENAAGAVDLGAVGSSSTTYTQVATLGSEWKFVENGDFFGDGASQFLIENTSGAVVVAEVVNGAAAFTQVSALGTAWKFEGAGDYLADGRDQFLIQNSNGAVVVGEVGTNNQATYSQVGALGSTWKFVETGDFLGDGKADFLIENSAGAIVAGEVGSGGAASYTQIASLGSEWKFVGAGDYLDDGRDQFMIENTSGALVIGDWLNGQIHYTQVSALGSEWVFHG